MTDLGDISHYLGMEVNVDLNKNRIIFWQFIYYMKILRQYGMTDYRLTKISISFEITNSLILYGNETKTSTFAYYS